MFRKKRQPAPFFRMPGAPFNPATGERARLGRSQPKGTTLAIFQVIGDDPSDPETADTHDNYVVCRGYEPDADPQFRHLYDPSTNQSDEAKSIKVAKPFAIRGTFPYERGQIVVAAKIRTKFGDNQGAASSSTGHPESLDEEIEILLDDDGVAVSWLDLGASSSNEGLSPTFVYFRVAVDRNPRAPTFTVLYESHFPAENDPPELDEAGLFNVTDDLFFFPRALAGGWGLAVFDDEFETWDVILCQQQCLLATALVNDTEVGMDGSLSVSIKLFASHSASPFNLTPDPLPTSAINLFNHKGLHEDFLLLAWSEVHEAYVVRDAEKHNLTVVSDVRVNSDKTQLQVFTNDCAVETNSEGAWQSKIPLKKCT